MSLLNILRDIQTPVEGEDVTVWKALKSWSFSVPSFYSALSKRTGIKCHFASLWKFKALPRVVAFGWIALQRRILTLDNLRRRESRCQCVPLCLDNKETIDHLLLSCRCVVNVWNSVISWFGCKQLGFVIEFPESF